MLLDKEGHEMQITPRLEPFTDYYEIEVEIGRGKFACVKRCRHRKSGSIYAAKFLRKRRKGRDSRADILHEVRMLELALVHPRLVDLVEVFESHSDVIIVMEYAAGGELFRLVQDQGALSEPDVVHVIRQLCEAMAYLHDKNVVHLDVKPQNVLLTGPLGTGTGIKLCDFGFARTVNSGDDVRDIIGTPDYVAPEVLNYDPIWQAADLWSLGVCAYVLLTGCAPFAGDTKQETFLNITQAEVDFPDDLFGDVSSEAQDCISKLLVLDPRDRLTARQCLAHSWLARPTTPPVPPFGSPIGCRRALTPPSPESADLEPSKKHKCCEDGRLRRSSDGGDVIKLSSPIIARSNSLRKCSRAVTPVNNSSRDCDSPSMTSSCGSSSLRVPSNSSSTTSLTEAMAGSSVQQSESAETPRSQHPRRQLEESGCGTGDVLLEMSAVLDPVCESEQDRLLDTASISVVDSPATHLIH